MAVGGAEERLDGAVLRPALLASVSVENGTSAAELVRSAAGTFVIASYPAAPRAAHSHTWPAR